MPIECKMPAPFPTVEEGTLAKWLGDVGKIVKSGDVMTESEDANASLGPVVAPATGQAAAARAAVPFTAHVPQGTAMLHSALKARRVKPSINGILFKDSHADMLVAVMSATSSFDYCVIDGIQLMKALKARVANPLALAASTIIRLS